MVETRERNNVVGEGGGGGGVSERKWMYVAA